MSQVNADTTGKLRVDFIAFTVRLECGILRGDRLDAGVVHSPNRGDSRQPPHLDHRVGCMNLSNPTMAAVQAFYVGAMAMFARTRESSAMPVSVEYQQRALFSAPAATPVLSSLGTVFVSEPQYK